MARDLTVRVRADVGPYQKAMSAAASSTDEFAQAGLRLQKVGLNVSQLGDTMTKNVTLPLVVAGGAAVKMASDFDKSFTQMQTLAGVSAKEVDGLKDSVLKLAGQTGRAPQELADALYFLSSSGLDSAQAMEALEVSAKASAVGLGSTEVVADAVSSAMLAYAESGLDAAEATDVLIATARAGKAEPAELAEQMGRLLPIASELGIEFGDVGGAIAALSTKGNDAAASTTQLTNVMSKLLKPSQQAAEMLDQVGLSTNSIREMIAEKGLLGTLEELRARLGESGFIKYFEDVQAVQGALGLLGGDLNKTRDIFDQVNNSVGATDNAFSTWAESMGAQNAQAFAQFQVALIEVGEVLAPIASDVLSFVASIAAAFSDLPGPVQTAIIAFAGLLAALGPIMSVGGRLITVVGTVIRLMSDFALPTRTVSSAFNDFNASSNSAVGGLSRLGVAARIAAGVAGLALLITVARQFNDAANRIEIDVDSLAAKLGDFSGKNREAVEEIIRASVAFGKFDEVVRQTADSNVAAAGRLVDVAEKMGIHNDAVESARDIIAEKRAEDVQAAKDSETNTAAVQEATGAYSEQAGAVGEAKSALQEYSDTLKAMTDPVFAAMDAVNGVRDAQVGLRDAEFGVLEAQAALNEAIRQHGPNSAEAAEATRGLEDAQRGLEDAQWATVTSAAGADSALAGLSDAVARGDVSVDLFRETLQRWVAQGFITQQQADVAAGAVDNLAGSAAEADKQRVEIPASTPGAPESEASLYDIVNAANAVPRGTNTNVSTTGTGSATEQLFAVARAVYSIPTERQVTVTTVARQVFGGTPFDLIQAGGKRAQGGPVAGGSLYEVGEGGKAELLHMGGRSYLIPGQNGFVTPASQWGAGGPGGVGGNTYVFNFPSYVGNRSELVSELNKAMDRGARIGRNGARL